MDRFRHHRPLFKTCLCVLLLCFATTTFSSALDVDNATRNGKKLLSSDGGSEVLSEGCQPDKLTVYKVILHTFWSRDKFPKHFPDWRPTAQWSKVIGRSHDKSFTLFKLGQKSSPGVKAFAETGRSDLLEEQSQGEGGIYDEFNAPPIATGVGRTEAEFFVDGNHSKVSLISKIIPSPDWFIGIDSFDLCVNGNWLDSITIEVDPVDAGTDNGFTFTAPNWPTEPQGVAYRITSRYPSHPAGSFFYPYMKRLPAIGTFQFIKVKEYELSEVFHHSEDDQHYEVLKMEHLSQNSINVLNGNSDIEVAIEEERKEQEVHQYPKPHQRMQQFLYTTTSSSSSPNKKITESSRESNTIRQADEATTRVSLQDMIPRGNKDAIMNSIVDSYRTHSKDHRRKKYRKPKKTRPPRDCRVGEWGPWSACSKSCGIGEMQRRREVIKHARRGGRLCPPLLETKWCGSARSCNRSYFQW
ncbi:spondin-1 [Onthophagus taurus]|uniref:spondin-1 n=1 Tax=Onthophagus taurus TaxID=166361 RepID=UPI000C200FF1|nr:uncharacterized protein LOC111420909 [Onthophagus taurus]